MTERPNMHQRIPIHDIYKRLESDMNIIQYFSLFFNITFYFICQCFSKTTVLKFDFVNASRGYIIYRVYGE